MGFFQKLKNKFVATIMALGSMLGIQYARPPVLDHSPPPIEIKLPAQASPSPTQDSSVDKYPEVTLGKINATQYQIDSFINPGNAQANYVLKTKCLKNKILDGTFTETNGLSNSQIWDVLSSNKITTGVVFFYGTWTQNYVYKTMGYDVGDGNIYANSFYIDTPALFGSMELHESEGHQQGFHHYNVFATSLPYQLNDFFDECVTEK